MSRAKATDVSSPISLFPFIGVLLCTMGALLVVLIAVSPSAREIAMRQVAASLPPRDATEDAETQRKLAEAEEYTTKLDQLRVAAEEKLQQGQSRLSLIESHMRGLQDQLQSVQVASAELDALEQEHYDDLRQAEEEIKRRNQLIAEMRGAIETAKRQASTKKRSYALVPYDGPNGTLRRPIYIECRGNALILQPEGVQISVDDLRPPYGAGNPLASALRAARSHVIGLHPGEGKHRDVEPYPLLLVRPSGATMFAAAQKAVQNSDFDFGYELVEEDWSLKYPAPDPQLAIVEQQAIDQARIRQQVLEAAAPRAYRNPTLALEGRFEFDDGENGRENPTGGSGSRSVGVRGEDNIGVFGDGSDGRGAEDGTGHGGGSASVAGKGNAGVGGVWASQTGETPFAGSDQQDGNSELASNESHGDVATNGIGTDGSGGPLSSGAAHLTGSGGTAGGDPSLLTGATQPTTPPSPDGTGQTGSSGGGGLSAPPSDDYTQYQPELAKSRGAGWALPRKNARAVSIQRTIQVVVAHDYVTIISDARPRRGRGSGVKTVPIQGDTVEAVDELVHAVHDQIDAWGMAGKGMTWRPVLSLHVAAGGERRANDLTRLLKNSGLELTPAATAALNSTGDSRATPRRN
jgi:hypothetical protein